MHPPPSCFAQGSRGRHPSFAGRCVTRKDGIFDAERGKTKFVFISDRAGVLSVARLTRGTARSQHVHAGIAQLLPGDRHVRAQERAGCNGMRARSGMPACICGANRCGGDGVRSARAAWRAGASALASHGRGYV